jgi:hypothetical protein
LIAHVVLFTPKAPLSSDERRRLGAAFADAIREIGAIRRARIGRRRKHGRAYEQLMLVDYTHAAILEFDDLPGLKAYLEHPAHQALATQFFASFAHALFYDFEMREGVGGVEALIEEGDAE